MPDSDFDQTTGPAAAEPVTAELSFVRLSVDDTEEICTLLNATWPALYGATGCPEFTVEYLAWLYGGPDSEEHLLLGSRLNGKLVGLKVLLYRPIRVPAGLVRAHLVTHLAIDSSLTLDKRAAIAIEFAQPHTLSGEYPGAEGPHGDATLAFFEEGKQLTKSADKLTRAIGITPAYRQFQHAIVNPNQLRRAVAGTSPHRVRDCTRDDCPRVAQVLGSGTPQAFALQPTPASLWHHVSGAPGGRAFVAEGDSGLSGFLACYVLGTVKNGHRSQALVIEFLYHADADALGQLLLAAVDYAQSCGLRGVVIENPPAIPGEVCSELGIMATLRTMVLVFRSKGVVLDPAESFFCDVK